MCQIFIHMARLDKCVLDWPSPLRGIRPYGPEGEP